MLLSSLILLVDIEFPTIHTQLSLRYMAQIRHCDVEFHADLFELIFSEEVGRQLGEGVNVSDTLIASSLDHFSGILNPFCLGPRNIELTLCLNKIHQNIVFVWCDMKNVMFYLVSLLLID